MARALADILGALCILRKPERRVISPSSFDGLRIWGKTTRAAKDGEGKAERVLPAFCGGSQTVPGHEAPLAKSRAERVWRFPMHRNSWSGLARKTSSSPGTRSSGKNRVAAKIVERGGGYVLPVKVLPVNTPNRRLYREGIRPRR